MSDVRDRQYLDDVPRDIQDLIYDSRGKDAAQLLMDQKGLPRTQATIEVARIALRLKQNDPDGLPTDTTLSVRQNTVFAWLFISIFLVVGSVFVGVGICGLGLGFESRSWPSAEGRITQSKVERHTVGSGKDRRPSYRAHVTYHFTVDGERYKGERVSSSDVGRGKSKHAERIVQRYPKGSAASVYYMPATPSNCLLEPGLQGNAFIFPSIGLFVLLLGGFFLAAQISVMRDERRAERHQARPDWKIEDTEEIALQDNGGPPPERDK